MYNQKLAKAKEKATKMKQMYEDADIRAKKIEEESKKRI